MPHIQVCEEFWCFWNWFLQTSIWVAKYFLGWFYWNCRTQVWS